MRRTEIGATAALDLSNCDKEPIRTPGSIQPHGLLMVLDDDFAVRCASRNTVEKLGLDFDDVIGARLEAILGSEAFRVVESGLNAISSEVAPIVVGKISLNDGATYYSLAHRRDGSLIVELEPIGDEGLEDVHGLYRPLETFLSNLDAVSNVDELAGLAAAEVRRLIRFDRALVYRFEEDGHGTVIAEDGDGELPRLLGQRFPASDVPSQARDLYLLNRTRLIVDATYDPVPIGPAGGPPIDLSHSTLRSVSPIHAEYMRNMGTAASMSVSVVHEGRLWGLICCHHSEPKLVPFGARSACDFLARVFALQIANKERIEDYGKRLALNALQARLVTALTAADRFESGLASPEVAPDLLAFGGASGAAILYEGQCFLVGQTPTEREVRRLADWLASEVRAEVFATDSLTKWLPWAEPFKEKASGALAVSISKLHGNFLIWFRPEVVQTVVWAGDPSKEEGDRIGPRRSFEAWKETVKLRSAPWSPGDVEAAREFRGAIVGVVLRRAEEMAALNAELTRSNQELEAFSYSVSHDLRAPLRHIVGFAELLKADEESRFEASARRFVDTIIESAQFAGTLVDNLLSFSRMGRATLHPVSIDMNALVRETIVEAERDAAGRSIDWEVDDLPPARGDLIMVRQALVNLLSNAVKYTRGRDRAVIQVRGEATDAETVYEVRDNGVGFDMKYAGKLFGVFQRLHRMEDFEGTGIGLANVKRVAARHGGRAWAEGKVGAGAAFHFSLPKGPEEHAQADITG